MRTNKKTNKISKILLMLGIMVLMGTIASAGTLTTGNYSEAGGFDTEAGFGQWASAQRFQLPENATLDTLTIKIYLCTFNGDYGNTSTLPLLVKLRSVLNTEPNATSEDLLLLDTISCNSETGSRINGTVVDLNRGLRTINITGSPVLTANTDYYIVLTGPQYFGPSYSWVLWRTNASDVGYPDGERYYYPFHTTKQWENATIIGFSEDDDLAMTLTWTLDCDENWVADDNQCTTSGKLISYTDANACGTTVFLPPDNSTVEECIFVPQNASSILGLYGFLLTGLAAISVIRMSMLRKLGKKIDMQQVVILASTAALGILFLTQLIGALN